MRTLTFECPECGEKQEIDKDLLAMRRSIGCSACKQFFVVEGLRANGFIYSEKEEGEETHQRS